MTDLGAVLEQLRHERELTQGRLKKLDEAIAVLAEVTEGSTSPSADRRQYRLSEAARERIAAAQRARWAKTREGSTTKGKTTGR